ncbi:LysE/ArgO family amino acid transporter [Brevibacterium yomogidense]|uniref:LysE/ArgO family amino acid transporter n=1 Tax=Brevibacterium yomogidense TaxID=946573 RepID=UPI0018DF7262|nr:LysE/ArgO family amino acid transporter [Brevibacterium yomogidense]
MTLLTLLAVGFATGIGLIIAIGPQNAFVLRQGIRREHVAVVVIVCALADIALIALGTAGIGIVFERAPWIVQIMRWGGVAYLVWFAYTSIRAAFGHDESLDPHAENDADAQGRDDAGAGAGVAGGTGSRGQNNMDTGSRGQVLVRSAGSIAVATAALTFLNPHVYLDTVVMLGTIANQHEPRWVFAGGAMLGSLVWFAGLGWGAHLLAPVLRSPRVWRAIDLGIAAVMLLVAAKLAFAF